MRRGEPALWLRLGLSVAGTGYIPKGGGTLAAALALPVAWALAPYPLILGFLVAALFAFGVWGGFNAEAHGWRHDDRRITIDEFCGMLACGFWLPSSSPLGSIIIFGSGFVVFRALDILKPPPLNLLERLPGGWGVMADDLAAGLVTNGLLRLIMLIPIPLIHGC